MDEEEDDGVPEMQGEVAPPRKKKTVSDTYQKVRTSTLISVRVKLILALSLRSWNIS